MEKTRVSTCLLEIFASDARFVRLLLEHIFIFKIHIDCLVSLSFGGNWFSVAYSGDDTYREHRSFAVPGVSPRKLSVRSYGPRAYSLRFDPFASRVVLYYIVCRRRIRRSIFRCNKTLVEDFPIATYGKIMSRIEISTFGNVSTLSISSIFSIFDNHLTDFFYEVPIRRNNYMDHLVYC